MSRKEFISDFISEARDTIDSAESCLLKLEEARKTSRPVSIETIHTLFRDFHTLKGSSALLGLQSIVTITHEAETLLDLVRNSSRPELILRFIEELLKTIDFLRILFQEIETTLENPKDTDRVEFVQEKLKRLVEALKTEIREDTNDPPISKQVSQNESTNYGLFDDEEIFKKRKSDTPKEPSFGFFEETQSPSGSYGLFEEKDTKPTTPVYPQSEQISVSEEAISEISDNSAQEPRFTAETFSRKKELKISTEKLDLLLDLVGELVIAESNVSGHPEIQNLKLEGFRAALRQLNKIVRDLQEVTLSTRMIPIAGIFNRMNRLVRDLEKKTKKKINFVVSGEETEIDKSIVELITDPIIHILRNSIDHGIEMPKERLEAGKKEEGTIRLHALQSANEVWIVILDDGKGIQKEKVLQKAYQRGIISEPNPDLTDQEIYELIFQPGFSTAQEVSDISGRGVGMDIVKRNIERLGGKIDIFSEEGIGTKIVLRIPLSLGIMEGTVFKTGDSYFTIQTIAIRELVKMKTSQTLEIYKGQRVVEIRGSHIPVLTINDILRLRKKIEYTESENRILIVLEKDREVLGLLADSIVGNQSIVIKSLNEKLAAAEGVNGFTILGNGRVSLILDTKAIFRNFRSRRMIHERMNA